MASPNSCHRYRGVAGGDGRVGLVDEGAAGDRLEQQQVAGLRFVQPRDEAGDRPGGPVRPEHEVGPARRRA